MRLRRLFATGLGTLALAGVLGIGSAGAAPTNAKSSFQFQADCDNGQSYTIVVNGNGAMTAGHIIAGDSGENLIPVALDIAGYDTDGNMVFSEQASKNGNMTGRQGSLTSCSIHQDIPGEGTVSGTAVVVVVPASH